jgi:hypothetical protein
MSGLADGPYFKVRLIEKKIIGICRCLMHQSTINCCSELDIFKYRIKFKDAWWQKSGNTAMLLEFNLWIYFSLVC